MRTINASKARAGLYRLLDEAAASHEPLHLLSIPGMRESIRKGMKTPVGKCSKDPGW